MSKVIDIHAHFFPQRFVETIKEVSKDYGGKVTSDSEGRFVIHLKGIDMGRLMTGYSMRLTRHKVTLQRSADCG